MRLTLNGFVSADDDMPLFAYFGVGAFSPRTVRDAIRATPQGEELVLEINSGGGSVMAGFEIYSVLRACGIQTRAEVQSLAASSASVMMLGCRTIMLSPVAQVMIHLPSTVTDGDERAHRDSIRVLRSIKESILNAYEVETGRDRALLARLMERSTWMSAQEALGAGLADGILYIEGDSPLSLPGAAPDALGDSSGTPWTGVEDATTEALRGRYARLVAAGQAPPLPTLPAGGSGPDWRDAARLRIARAKF
ncbi:MAG: Clp protease ClpP [Oscillospiraceae bacterium]|nr:Clp protease ClpP [Oscillospiraceae bacterium]